MDSTAKVEVMQIHKLIQWTHQIQFNQDSLMETPFGKLYLYLSEWRIGIRASEISGPTNSLSDAV